MSSGVVTVGRRQYASGLYWENSPSGRITQAAKEAARQPGQQAEFFAVRAGNRGGRVPQFALSPGNVGHKAGMPVLAACLANQQPGSWAGAFRLREGTAVVVVRDDLIVPDGDQFFADETEARDRLLQEMALGGFQRIYAPEAWGIPGADTMPISLLLNDRTDIKLRQVTIPQSVLVFGGGIVVLILLGLAIGWYIQDKNAKDEDDRRRQLALIEQMKRDAGNMLPTGMQSKVEYPSPVRVWEKKPQPMAVVEACRVALSQVSLAVYGWQIASQKCDGTGLTMNWSRTSGFSSPPPRAIVSATGMTASLTIPYPALTPRDKEDLEDQDTITKHYLEQNWPGSINRVVDDPLPPPPPDFKGAWNPPPAPWVKRSFTVTVPQLPWTLPEFFGDIKGVIINTLTSTGGGMNAAWTVEGVIYENRH